MQVSTYQIARRAFSQYVVVETFTGTFVEVTLRCMELNQRRDGEYIEFREGETVGQRPGQAFQSGFDYL